MNSSHTRLILRCRSVIPLVSALLVLTSDALHAQYQWNVFAGSPGQLGDFKDATGKEARFRTPYGLTLSDLDGNLYVADSGNHAVRKITPSGEVTTVTGGPKKFNHQDGDWAQAGFTNISYIAASGGRDLFLAQRLSPPAIRRIMPEGGVITLKTPKSFDLAFFGGLAVNSREEVILVHTSKSVIYKITKDGRITALAGADNKSGQDDGPGPKARFFRPEGIAVDAQDNIYIADAWNHTIRKISGDGSVSTLAGGPFKEGMADGVGSAARFHNPMGIAVDSRGNLYVTDYFNNRVCLIDPSGRVTTIGSSFDHPIGIAVDKLGSVYVADTGRHCIMRGSPTSLVPAPVAVAPPARSSPPPSAPVAKATPAAPAAPVPAAKGLSSKDIIALLGAGFTPADVIAEVQKRGYQGGMDAAVLQQIRAAGGNADLILALNNAPAPSSGSPPMPAPSGVTQAAQNSALQKLGDWVRHDIPANPDDPDDHEEYFGTAEWLRAFLMFGAATSVESEGITPMQKEWPGHSQVLYPQISVSDDFDSGSGTDTSEAKAYQAFRLLGEWWREVENKIPPVKLDFARKKAAGAPLYSLMIAKDKAGVIWLDVRPADGGRVLMVIALGTGKALDAIADKHLKPAKGNWANYRAMHKSYALTRWPSYGRKDWLFQTPDRSTLAVWHQQAGGHPPSAEHYPSVLSTYNNALILLDTSQWETFFKDAPDFQNVPFHLTPSGN